MDELINLKAKAFDIGVQIETLVQERMQVFDAIKKFLLEEKKKPKQSN